MTKVMLHMADTITRCLRPTSSITVKNKLVLIRACREKRRICIVNSIEDCNNFTVMSFLIGLVGFRNDINMRIFASFLFVDLFLSKL